MWNMDCEVSKNNMKDNFDFYITCCIPIIPFCLSAHMLLYLSEGVEMDIGGFGNVLLMLSCMLLLICLAVFRYSLKAYIRQKSGQYSILLMLGISNRDFWRNLAAEYCPSFLLVTVCVALSGSVLGNLLMIAMLHVVSAEILLFSVKITLLLVLLFAAGMTGTLLIFMIEQWRKDLVNYLDNLNHGKELLHRFRLSYGMKILMSVLCLFCSFYLLIDYTVGKMIVAALMHLTGVYFLLQINGRLIRKVLKIRRKRYFQHLLIWNDFIHEYRMNGNLIYSIYTVNFIMVFLFGGLFASDFPKEAVYTVLKMIIALLGLAIIFEEQSFILCKMILDLRKEKERHDILFQIGIGQETYAQLIEGKIKGMVLLPMTAASVMGAVFFLCDYIYQGDITAVSGMWSMVLLKYMCAVAVFWGIQYCGYLFLSRRILRRYEEML